MHIQEKFKDMKKLCLSMIVKNEMVNLERCLSSVADHIDCWVIGDTGSTDGTQDFIRAFFAKRGLPGELHSFPFVNFEQARNDALRRAYDSELEFDYLLLADADMELVVEDLGFRAKLEGPGYQLMQRAGSGLVYWNARLVRRDVGAWYHGVTHEYLDVPGGVTRLTGLWYKDHATGANRVDKFERDIRLLMEALKLDPGNVRYHFYLAQSYRDAGRKQEAADAYAQRADMGGWDEEVWVARRQLALCLRDLGDESGFRQAALAAFNLRPQRAEPLYDLAHHYRIKGWNDVSTLFSERGMEIAIPKDDILFVEEWIYRYGLREEFSISANYARDADRKDRGFAACEWLALNRDIPAGTRELAFSNLQYYVQPINQLLPSFVTRQLEFTPPEGFKLLNPSVARCGEDIFVCQRAINYGISEDGSTYETANGEPVQMRNFLLRLDEALRTRSCAQILLPEQAADQRRRRLAPLGGLAAILLERQLVVRRDRPRSVPSSIGRSEFSRASKTTEPDPFGSATGAQSSSSRRKARRRTGCRWSREIGSNSSTPATPRAYWTRTGAWRRKRFPRSGPTPSRAGLKLSRSTAARWRSSRKCIFSPRSFFGTDSFGSTRQARCAPSVGRSTSRRNALSAPLAWRGVRTTINS